MKWIAAAIALGIITVVSLMYAPHHFRDKAPDSQDFVQGTDPATSISSTTTHSSSTTTTKGSKLKVVFLVFLLMLVLYYIFRFNRDDRISTPSAFD